MSETASIEFVLHGKVEGQEITPHTIGLSQFNEFNQQVETFIGGSQKLKLEQVHVEIRQSSYVLRAILPAVVWSGLEPDLKLMAREDVLGQMDVKRAEVVQKWQERAKSNPDLSYEVRPRSEGLQPALPQGAAARSGGAALQDRRLAEYPVDWVRGLPASLQ